MRQRRSKASRADKKTERKSPEHPNTEEMERMLEVKLEELEQVVEGPDEMDELIEETAERAVEVTLAELEVAISPDRLNASIKAIPPGIEYESVISVLSQRQVTFGVDEQALRDVIRRANETGEPQTGVLVARGQDAVPGTDAQLNGGFDLDGKAGKVLEDGSIDFRERSTVYSVKAGQVIGEKIPPTKGTAGKDVTGRSIPSPEGADRIVEAGQNVKEEGKLKFYAKIDGAVEVKQETAIVEEESVEKIVLQVNPLSQMEGDVDYSTGNVRFVGNVEIRGSVRSGFSVEADGTISIGDNVESGAKIVAGGDVAVKNGIVGKTTDVFTSGLLSAKFIQEASVTAKRNVEAGCYIFNANVNAGDRVMVYGKGDGRTAGIVGGLVWGAQGIESKVIGSPATSTTRLVAGIKLEKVKRLNKTQEGLDFCEKNIEKILKVLGLRSLESSEVKKAMGRLPKEKRSVAITCIKKINKLLQFKDNLLKEQEEIEQEMKELCEQVAIKVTQAFHGVDICIGDCHTRIRQDLGQGSFRVIEKDGEPGIKWLAD